MLQGEDIPVWTSHFGSLPPPSPAAIGMCLQHRGEPSQQRIRFVAATRQRNSARDPTLLDFLPYHFLLVSAGADGMCIYVLQCRMSELVLAQSGGVRSWDFFRPISQSQTPLLRSTLNPNPTASTAVTPRRRRRRCLPWTRRSR